jgi:hypothetical protein
MSARQWVPRFTGSKPRSGGSDGEWPRCIAENLKRARRTEPVDLQVEVGAKHASSGACHFSPVSEGSGDGIFNGIPIRWEFLSKVDLDEHG